jgi:hypothetical protein
MVEGKQPLVALGGSGVFMALVTVVQGVIAWTVRCDGCGARLGITRKGARGVRSRSTLHTVVLTPLESFPIADLYYPILKM